MYEYFYNGDFTEHVEQIIYNKHLSQMPNSFLKFVKKKTESLIICDEKTNTYYCAKCFNKLTDSIYCDTCGINYQYTDNNTMYIDDIKKDVSLDDRYYYFDVVNNNVLVYCIKRKIILYSEEELNCQKELGVSYDGEIHKSSSGVNYSNRVDIDWVIKIEKDKIYDLKNNIIYSYAGFDRNGSFSGWGYIYTNNLDKLKNTDLFKYKPLWKCKNYFKSHMPLRNIIYYTLTNECFEYLVNLKLYNLAFNSYTFEGSFEKTLGVDKSYLDFMVKNNIDWRELDVLKLLKVKDIELIRSLAKIIYIYSLKHLKEEYSINILKVIDYFNKNKIEYKKLPSYYEYIKIVSELGYNLKDKKVLYPIDFDDTFDTMSEIYYSQIDKDIERVGSVLDINKYEDDKYIIYAPKLAKSIVDEANQQQNCLLTYLHDYSKGKSQIYFMRKKDEIDKSLVTIEVADNKVVQARARFNAKPSQSLLKVVKKWEKNLIPVDIS